MFHDRTKHIKVKHHFIREKVTQGLIDIEKILCEETPADRGTKIVSLNKVQYCLKLLSIEEG